MNQCRVFQELFFCRDFNFIIIAQKGSTIVNKISEQPGSGFEQINEAEKPGFPFQIIRSIPEARPFQLGLDKRVRALLPNWPEDTLHSAKPVSPN